MAHVLDGSRASVPGAFSRPCSPSEDGVSGARPSRPASGRNKGTESSLVPRFGPFSSDAVTVQCIYTSSSQAPPERNYCLHVAAACVCFAFNWLTLCCWQHFLSKWSLSWGSNPWPGPRHPWWLPLPCHVLVHVPGLPHVPNQEAGRPAGQFLTRLPPVEVAPLNPSGVLSSR